MFDQVQDLVDEYVDLERQLADPSVHADQSKARTLGRRYAELGPIVSTYKRWQALGEDLGVLVGHALDTDCLVLLPRADEPDPRAVEAVGGRAVSGLEMLLHQAALQVELFTGRSPDVEAMRAAVGTTP